MCSNSTLSSTVGNTKKTRQAARATLFAYRYKLMIFVPKLLTFVHNVKYVWQIKLRFQLLIRSEYVVFGEFVVRKTLFALKRTGDSCFRHITRYKTPASYRWVIVRIVLSEERSNRRNVLISNKYLRNNRLVSIGNHALRLNCASHVLRYTNLLK